VTAEARPYGATKFHAVAATRSGRTGRFRLTLRPRIGQVVRLSSGAIAGPAFVARVQPHVLLGASGSRLVAKVFAARSYAGRRVTLQRQGGSGWTTVRRVTLGARSKAVMNAGTHGNVRLLVPAAPGYAAAASAAVAVP
jgi:hypothetical protein